MSEFEILRNEPIPERTRLPDFPLGDLKVSDCIVYKLKTEKEAAAIRQRLSRYQSSHPPVKFSMTQIDDGTVKIQRIEDAE